MSSRSDLTTISRPCSPTRTPVRLPFISTKKNVISDFEFVIVEQICNLSDNYSVDERLLTREAFWSAQLCTLQPYGLNKRTEFNSRNRIVYLIKNFLAAIYMYMYIFLHIFYIHIDFFLHILHITI